MHLHKIDPRTFRQLFEADAGQGSGGEGAPAGSDPSPQGGEGTPPGVQSLMTKHGGDAGAVAALLYQENYQYRERIRQMQEQIPPKDAVILTDPADLEAWNGRGDLAAQLEQAQQQLTAYERRQAISSAAAAAGYKESVLAGLVAQIDQPAALETAEKDGETIATIRIGEEADPIPLADYASEHWADFMPALQPEERPTGTNYPGQAGSNGSAPQGGGVADLYLKRVQERAQAPNALRPAARKE